MGKITLTPACFDLFRNHLREELRDPKVAKEILDAVNALEMPVENLLTFIAGGDIVSTPEETSEQNVQ